MCEIKKNKHLVSTSWFKSALKKSTVEIIWKWLYGKEEALQEEIKPKEDFTSFLQDTIEEASWFQKKNRNCNYIKRCKDKSARAQHACFFFIS